MDSKAARKAVAEMIAAKSLARKRWRNRKIRYVVKLQ